MPAHNFDDVLKIENGRISPRGKLDLATNETMSKLYALVFQVNGDGTGAACMAFQDEDGFKEKGVWTTKPDAVHEGAFRPGRAVGRAMAISKRQPDGKPIVFSWREDIQLE
jgi:hypothetical protein